LNKLKNNKNNYKHSKSLIVNYSKQNNNDINIQRSVLPMNNLNYFKEENISNILSIILFLKYRLKYKLFKEVIYKNLYDLNFEEICSKCENKIKNIIYTFKSYKNDINDNNQNYNLCEICLSKIIKNIKSNLVYKYLPEFKSNQTIKKEPSISVEFLELKYNNQIIKENDEIKLLYSCVKDGYIFNLKFKYLNCKEGDINSLLLYKNDGSGFVSVTNFSKKKYEKIDVEFKLRNLDKKYIGKYKRQIYFKSSDKFESNKFTFYINIIADEQLTENLILD
jgi:hypothetical protein